MHIPDGYIGPQTYVPAMAVTAAFWSVGAARLKQSLRMRQVPLLALGAAFSFVIMMFNIPIPGGSSGHAVGAVLVAILLGPWAAMIAVSLALIVQALLFGDGGITAIGANCLNIAIIMPFAGWGAYRLITGASPVSSRRHWIGGALGGYIGLVAAAVATGVEFGIQPLIAHDAVGRALYCPFGLGVAVPAMAAGHLLVFGPVEALVTGLAVAYLQRTSPEMIAARAASNTSRNATSIIPKLAIAIGVLVVLVPLGLYLPQKLHSGPAWGEWSSGELAAEMARRSPGGETYVPEGLRRAENAAAEAPLPDYALPGQAAPSPAHGPSYVLSGAIGVAVIGLVVMALGSLFARRSGGDGSSRVDAPADDG